jgi:peroxiredoxin
MKSFFQCGLLVAAMLMTAACGQGESAKGQIPPLLARSALPVVGQAPSWTLSDVDGREVKSTDFKGKVVVVDFWATWCPPCRKELPEYVALQKKYADRGLVILGFSLDELPAAQVKAFAEKMKVNYPILMANAETAEAFGGVQGLPTAFVIDREGQIRHVKVGLSDPEAYEKLIASLL